MKANPETEAAVINVVNRFADAFAKQDLNAMLELYAPDPDVVVIGTGSDEKRIGLVEIKDLFKRDFAQFRDASLQVDCHTVSAAGSVAWAAADATVNANTGDQELLLQVRLTFVLERRGDKWLIVQFHGSAPAAGQEEGEAFPKQ
ncbi:MAG TPA: nuclear transport factor 2 family protein [Dehalococcoidia bacterium]|nr:nuclear transport factor 2 family protein [Dehalococcoidia bacterium]